MSKDYKRLCTLHTVKYAIFIVAVILAAILSVNIKYHSVLNSIELRYSILTYNCYDVRIDKVEYYDGTTTESTYYYLESEDGQDQIVTKSETVHEIGDTCYVSKAEIKIPDYNKVFTEYNYEGLPEESFKESVLASARYDVKVCLIAFKCLIISLTVLFIVIATILYCYYFAFSEKLLESKRAEKSKRKYPY